LTAYRDKSIGLFGVDIERASRLYLPSALVDIDIIILSCYSLFIIRKGNKI
jgi:hypothetical protein